METNFHSVQDLILSLDLPQELIDCVYSNKDLAPQDAAEEYARQQFPTDSAKILTLFDKDLGRIHDVLQCTSLLFLEEVILTAFTQKIEDEFYDNFFEIQSSVFYKFLLENGCTAISEEILTKIENFVIEETGFYQREALFSEKAQNFACECLTYC